MRVYYSLGPLLLLWFSSCSQIAGSDRQAVPTLVELPHSWAAVHQTNVESPEADTWWTGFQSQTLVALLQQTLDRNADIQIALARLEQTRAMRRVVDGDKFPSIDAAAAFERSNIFSSDSSSSRNTKVASAGLSLSYEVDLFGRRRHLREAVEAEEEQALWDVRAVRALILAESASTYFDYLAAQRRYQLSRDTSGVAREILDIIEARYAAGRASLIEVAQQRAAVANFSAETLENERQMQVARTALAVIIGVTPSGFETELDTLEAIGVPPISVQQPVTVLMQRPDVLAREAALRRAQADIGVARAELFPSFVLGLDFSGNAPNLESPISYVLSQFISIAAPVVRGGSLRAEVDRAEAAKDQAMQEYRLTLLTAIKEVEDALVSCRLADEREQILKVSRDESERAYQLSTMLYREGSIDFQVLLDAQAAFFDAEGRYVTAKQVQLQAAAELYKALGGGWW